MPRHINRVRPQLQNCYWMLQKKKGRNILIYYNHCASFIHFIQDLKCNNFFFSIFLFESHNDKVLIKGRISFIFYLFMALLQYRYRKSLFIFSFHSIDQIVK